MDAVFTQFVTGLADATPLFLVAGGLSWIFSVTRIVNFAQGAFYLLGAYICATLVGGGGPDSFGFWFALAVSAVVVGGLGAGMEILLLRRLYRASELNQLLATLGVVLVLEGLVLIAFGGEPLRHGRGPEVPGAALLGSGQPGYELFLIVLGPAALALLWLLLHGTRWGLFVRAASEDREMLAALGVSHKGLCTTVVFLGTALAALGGALQLPRETLVPGIGLDMMAQAFVVVVAGGLGSLPGAFVAALLVAQLNGFGVLILPQAPLALLALAIVLVLALRPQGLLGQADFLGRMAGGAGARPTGNGWPAKLAFAGAVPLLALFPVVANDFLLAIMSEVLILALFAASLQFLMSVGGMASLGHAVFLGLGAYGAALTVLHMDLPMEAGLVAAPVCAGLGALFVGWFCVRLPGIYLAMLTLAFAQIAWSAATYTSGALGAMPELTRSAWAGGTAAFYCLVLAVVTLAMLLLSQMTAAPFGYALRAARDSPLRAEVIGIDVVGQRWSAFALAGAFAGISGGLFAYLEGRVVPRLMDFGASADAIAMVVLGGFQALIGPLLGATVVTGLNTQVPGSGAQGVLLGAAIIALVVVFPNGIAGSLRRLAELRR